MKTFLFCIIMLLALVVFFFILVWLELGYKWLRCKINKPLIGFENFNGKLLKRGDYVSIDGKVLCFSHTARKGQTINPIMPPLEGNKTLEGELAFTNHRGLGYIYYPSSSLKGCDFIYGKYGVKWAYSHHWASIAEDKVENYIWDRESVENQDGKDVNYTIVNKNDRKDYLKDKYGIIYSKDGKRVLNYKCNLLNRKKNIHIKQNVEIICDAAFLRKKVEEIELPNSLTCIGLEAFFKSNLKSINLHDNIRMIKGGAFAFCTSLVSIEIPSSIQSISVNLFEGCSNLEEIVLPNNLLNIGNYAFSGCSKLKNISLPKTIASIGSSAFEDCKSLVAIELPKDVSVVNSYTFSFCSSLDKVSLANVQRIEHKAFSFCNSLKYLEITETVNYVGNHAFLGCELLKTVCFNSKDVYVSENAFERCNNLACVFIPKGSKLKFEEMLPQYKMILIER